MKKLLLIMCIVILFGCNNNGLGPQKYKLEFVANQIDTERIFSQLVSDKDFKVYRYIIKKLPTTSETINIKINYEVYKNGRIVDKWQVKKTNDFHSDVALDMVIKPIKENVEIYTNFADKTDDNGGKIKAMYKGEKNSDIVTSYVSKDKAYEYNKEYVLVGATGDENLSIESEKILLNKEKARKLDEVTLMTLIVERNNFQNSTSSRGMKSNKKEADNNLISSDSASENYLKNFKIRGRDLKCLQKKNGLECYPNTINDDVIINQTTAYLFNKTNYGDKKIEKTIDFESKISQMEEYYFFGSYYISSKQLEKVIENEN